MFFQGLKNSNFLKLTDRHHDAITDVVRQKNAENNMTFLTNVIKN